MCPATHILGKLSRRYSEPCESQVAFWGGLYQSTTFSLAPMSILPRSVGSKARIISAILASCGGVTVATRGRLLGRGCIFSFLTCL
jgi:hypothetical protein